MAAARERLANARDDLAQEHLAGAASAAYYAMLCAARAALSERDLSARTHSGVWSIFRETFVLIGDMAGTCPARKRGGRGFESSGIAKPRRPARDDAEELVEPAGEFIEAVERMLAGPR